MNNYIRTPVYYQGAVYIFQFLKSEIETGKVA